MKAVPVLCAAAALAGCAGRSVASAPASPVSGIVTVWVTDGTDTLEIDPAQLAHQLGATALRWQVADTTDVATLVARGNLPLVAHTSGPTDGDSAASDVLREPLPAGTLYALVSDSAAPISALADPAAAAALRDDLVNYAVTGATTTAAESPPPVTRCDTSIARAKEIRPRIAYLRSDPIARQIAERLAALSKLSAVPLAGREFGWALSDGREAGVVAGFRRNAPQQGPSLFCGASVTPLVETHLWLLRPARP